MVYSVLLPKRQERPVGPLETLPDEVLLIVMPHLPIQTIQNLKLACPQAVGACDTAIAERCKALYLHPTKTSLRQFLEICAHDAFSKKVETLVLQAKDMWPLIDKHDAFFSYQPLTSTLSWPASQFRPWPSSIASELHSKNSAEVAASGEEPFHGFGEAYGPLIDAVKSLPRLRHIALEETTTRTGGSLNMVSRERIDAHGNKAATTKSTDPGRLSDAEVLFNIIAHAPQVIDSLELGVSHPFLQEISLATEKLGTSPNPFRALTSLNMAVESSQDDGITAVLYRHIISLAKLTLQTLRIRMTPGPTSKNFNALSMRHKTTKSVFLMLLPNDNILPKLWTFEIDHPVQQHPSNRPNRPCYLHFDAITFLHTHRDTLTNVSFKNVLFSSVKPALLLQSLAIPTPQPITSHNQTIRQPAVYTLEWTIELLAHHLPLLERCEWLVPRFTHHPHCKKEDDYTTLHPGAFKCGQYEAIGQQPTDLREEDCFVGFERLAEGWGLRFEEGRRFWDFGGRVGEVIRMEKERE